MKYVQPYGVSDENAPYINGNPSIGVAGSIPPAGAFEAPQREIINAITSGGLTPSPSDMTQLAQVLSKIGVRFAIDTSSAAGSIVITPIPAIIDLTIPTMIAVKVGHDCPGASTITYGTAAQYAAGTQVTKPVRRGDGTALQEGDYSNGGMLLLMFDGVNFQLVASGLIASGNGGSGTPGAPGQPGSQIYSGAAVPDTGLGINDDYYIRTTTLDMYKRVSGSWGIILNFRTAIPGVTLPATYDGATNKYSVRKGSLTEGGYGRVANSAEALAGTSATIDGINLPWITPELLAMVITDRLAAYAGRDPFEWLMPAGQKLAKTRLFSSGATAGNFKVPIAIAPIIGGLAPVRYKLASGSLPASCAIHPELGAIVQTIVATPGEVGTYTFEITATDRNGQAATRQFTLEVSAVVPIATGSDVRLGGFARSGTSWICRVNDNIGVTDTSVTDVGATLAGGPIFYTPENGHKFLVPQTFIFDDELGGMGADVAGLPPGCTVQLVDKYGNGVFHFYYYGGVLTTPGNYIVTVAGNAQETSYFGFKVMPQ